MAFIILSDDLFAFEVVILPHNLWVVNYTIGIPGSLHDATAFQHTQIACSPEQFFGPNERLWADSVYGCHPWCIVPFKRPTEGNLTRSQKTFNYHLSKVCLFYTVILKLILVPRCVSTQNTFLGQSRADFSHYVICEFKSRPRRI